jgi:hypothetical protein
LIVFAIHDLFVELMLDEVSLLKCGLLLSPPTRWADRATVLFPATIDLAMHVFIMPKPSFMLVWHHSSEKRTDRKKTPGSGKKENTLARQKQTPVSKLNDY